MATFAIDLFSGKQYLFNGNYTNSGMTTFTGITTAINGLTRVGLRQVKLGGTLTLPTVIIKGAGNTAGIEYGGDYSTSFSNRSFVDKGYVDNKVSGNTQWGKITGTLSGQTDLQLALNDKLKIAISITYNALITLMNSNSLIKAQFYIITDFQTIHNIYDADTVLPEVHTGSIVPLNVQALSTNELSNTVTSTLFPQDLLYYDVRDNICEDGVTPRKGKITYRKNVISNIEAHYDYKEVVFRRWKFQLSGYTQWISGGEYNVGDEIAYDHYLYVCNKSISGSTDTPDILIGNFSPLINDNDYLSWQSTNLTIGSDSNGSNTYPVNANAYKDFHTFTDLNGNEKSSWFNNVVIGAIDFATTNLHYNSIIFVETTSGQTYNISFNYNNFFMTFGAKNNTMAFGVQNNCLISQGNNNIIVNNYNTSLLLGKNNSYLIVNNYNRLITWGSDNSATLFGSGNAGILLGNNNNTLTFQDGNSNSVFNYSNSNIIIHSLNVALFFGSGNTIITLSNNNDTLTFGDDNHNLIFYSHNTNIVFGNNNYDILINTNNDNITFDNNNRKIEIHNSNTNITFNNNNSGDTFTNNISNFNFSGITLISNFFFNDLDGTGIVFTGATHLTQDYTCEIFKRSVDGLIRLKYCDNSDVIKVVAVNA